MKKILTAIGLMSGTSLDGIDVAVIKTDGEKIHELGDCITVPYSAEIKQRIKDAIAGNADKVQYLERDLTIAHADAVKEFLATYKQNVDIIGFHGQTVYHNPQEKITWQLGNGILLSELTGIDVVCNFRGNDVAKGGQGAPLVPIFHNALVQDTEKPVAIVNIGGIANVSWIGKNNELLAFDTGAGNTLIDRWVYEKSGKHFDDGGKLAEAGEVNQEVLQAYLADEFYQQKPPKSLDTIYFDMEKANHLSLEDGAATFAALTADTIADAVRFFPEKPKKIFVAGGGRKNAILMQMLHQNLKEYYVDEIDSAGINGDALEAYAFGFLAVRSLYQLPITYPNTTGVQKPTHGGVLCNVS